MILIIESLFILFLTAILFVIYQHERMVSKTTASQAKVEEYWRNKERRLHFRFKKDLEVTYLIEKKVHLKNNGRTVDISEGGMKLLLDKKLAKGAILDLKIFIPGSKAFAEVEGEVVWLEEVNEITSEGKRLFHAGIKFLALKEPANASLVEYIRSLPQIPQRLKEH